MSSGWAAWPLEEMTYFGLGSPEAEEEEVAVMPADEGGRVDGMDL